MPPEAVYDTARTPPCETFAEYVATLPPWERELLPLATELYGPDSSLYELLQQKNRTILAASDGDQKGDHGSFGWVIGWVIGTQDEVIWDCDGSHEATQCSPTELKVMAACLSSCSWLITYVLQYQTGVWSTCHLLL
jgi:hypothetical protein